MVTSPANSTSQDEAAQQQASSTEQSEFKQLSDEDMARVQQYLSSPIHTVDRKPFRPVRLLIMLLAVMSTLSILSLLLARLNGIY